MIRKYLENSVGCQIGGDLTEEDFELFVKSGKWEIKYEEVVEDKPSQ